MLGELIKKFEELPTNTVADFNSIFRDCMLSYPPDYEVEIGPLEVGSRRLLLINGEIVYHDLVFFGTKKPKKKTLGNTKAVRLFYADDTLIGEFPTVQDAQNALNMVQSTFAWNVKTGKIKMEKINE